MLTLAGRSLVPLLIGATLFSCTASRAPAVTATAQATQAAATPAVTGAAALAVSLTDATYGSLAVLTAAGASCSAQIRITPGDFGEPPNVGVVPDQVAGPSGIVRWTYPAPRVGNSAGSYDVHCQSGTSSGSVYGRIDTARPPMVATDIAVHITTATPPRPEFQPDPALVPLRDAVVARITATLSDEWGKATRGLGHLRIVDASQDISIFVVGAKGTSVHRQSPRDESEDIEIFVQDDLGKTTPENAVATTLHELGHIWCCFGPEADQGGHWQVKLRDPGLYGVDKYGLMTDPVLCLAFGAVLSCPNRFSDREMRALGFATFPAAVPDPCVSQALSLQTQQSGLVAQLDVLGPQIDAGKTRLATLETQISSLEAQYPNGMPPAVYANYQTLISQHNALVVQVNAQIDQYNAQAAQVRSIVAQRNALPCDAS
ncbi:MAG TPA: hypothetical protein VEU77_13155 [Candidatus Acidoferrales bacterium]|nr:hypothetical protein [Candidatus Acidoferrales bacterium]